MCGGCTCGASKPQPPTVCKLCGENLAQLTYCLDCVKDRKVDVHSAFHHGWGQAVLWVT